MSSNFFDQFDTDSPPQNFFDQFDTEAPGSQKETGPFLGSGAPAVSKRPVARPPRQADLTDDARAERGFGRSSYMDGLTDAPAVPANDLSGVGSVDEQLDTARRREQAGDEESQPIGDLGSRFARGATEVAASLPEAAAIAGAGNPNASALFAKEEVDRAREQIALAEQRLSENPDMSEEGRERIQDVIAAERRKVAAYEPLIATAEGPLKPAAQDRPLFQRGDKLRAVSEELFGTPDPQFDDRFISKLAEGGGSMAGFVGATILTGLPGIVATGSAVNSSGMYRRAIQEGASEEQARTAAYLGAIVGTTEAVPIGRALNLLPAKARGRVANALGRRLSDAFRSAGEEGAQEAMTEISNNLIARGIWNPDQNAFDGAGEAALIGAILGGGLGAIASTPRDDQRLDSPRLTEADRASPLPNAVIDDGKAAIEDLLSGNAPVQPAPQQTTTNPPSNLPSNAAPAGGEAPQAPAQPLQEQTPVAASAMPEPEAMTRAPAQPEGGDAEVLPVMDENGRETGEFVRLNPTTGQIEKITPDAPVEVDTTPAPTPQAESSKEETIADEPSAPRQEAEQPQGQTGPDVTPVDLPQAAGSVEVVERKARGKTTLQKRPVANELKTRGLTVKPGSPLADELKARGINARTHPGLFNSNGVSDWDNLPADEWGDYRYEVGEDGNGYLNRQGVIDALESEMRGAPVQVGEQADLQMAADAKEAQARFEAADLDPEEIDLGGVEDAAVVITHPEEDISTPSERMEYVARSVDAAMAEIGMSGRVAAGRRQEIIGILNDRGGNVEDAVWWNLHREADGYGQQSPETRLAEKPADGQTARGSDVAPEVSGDPGRSTGQFGPEGQRQGIDPYDRRADERQAQKPAASEVSAPAASGKPETLPKLTSEPVTDQQQDQIEDYLERSIRSASSLSEQEQQRIDKTYAENGNDDVASSIRKGMVPLNEDLTVYRGEALDEVGGGLMSVTLSENTARNFGRVRKIELKAGTPVFSPRSGISGGEILVEPKNLTAAPTTERTEAGEQAVIPGAEQSAERSAEARKADERREMEARQQQSKARTAVPQDDAGPLFDTQGDMFDAPKGEVSEPKAKPEAPKAKPSKTQERLTGILRDEWTAREDLPEDANDDFIAATKRVQDARRALADEFGEDAAKSALEEIEAGYKPKPAEPVQERTDQEPVKKERIDDFGEKIGGAPAATWVASARKQDAMELPDSLSAEADPEVAHDVDEGNVRTYQAAAVARGHAPARREAYTFAEAKEAVKEFRGLPLVNRDSGIEAVVSSNSLGKMLSMSAVAKSETPAVHSLAVANIDSLFENAIYGWMKPDERGQHGVAGMHRLFARMDKPDGSASMVKLTVKETERANQQNKLYTVEAVEFLDDGASAETWVMSAFRSDGNGPKIGPSAEAILDIARDVEKFNSLEGKELRADSAKLKELMPALRERLDKLMIRGVDLSIDPDMDEQGAVEFGPEGIQILIGNTLGGMNTVNHEAIHVLRARGLFTEAEWNALAAEAENRWMAEHDIEARYPDLSKQAQVEEAIAEAFAAHVDGQAAQGRLKSAFAKISRFFRAMKEALTGQGIRTPEDIFETVESGEVGSRDGRVTGEELTKYQRPSSAVRKMKPEGVQATAVATHSAAIPDDTRFERFRRLVQDRMLVLRRMEEATEELTGQGVRKEESPYFAEERYSGRVGYLLDEIDANFTQPIVDLISEAKIEITDQNGNIREGSDAVSLWLMARHAKERNAHIASINDQMPDGGSGLTNAEADAILQQAGPYQSRLDQIGALTDQLGKEMITAREDAGLLSAQDAHIWRTMYRHYVPLQKFAEDDMFDGVVNDKRTAMGRKFNVRGKEGQRALGRSTEAFDPLATLLTQAMEVTVRAEKNRVAKVMYNFAVRHPNPAMYEISTPETQRFYNNATGKVETRVVGAAARPLAENEMALKVDGKEHRITFKDPRLAEALGQLGTNEMGKVTSIASLFSRYFSSINTMLSPPFIIVNAFRDMMTAQVNLGAAGGNIPGKLRKAAMRDWVKSLRGAHRGLGGKTDTEYAKWFNEYSEAGGRIHFWKVDNPEGQSVDFKKRVARASRGKLTGTVSRLALPSTRDNPVLSMIENVNMAVDNAVRLATYAEARKNGWSKADAASLAKNLTVNFNRRGEIGATMNAWYPFANAAIQGSHVILKAMRSRQVKKIVGGMVLFGFANDLLAAMLSGTDDDGELEYDQLPVYKSERNIIVATPLNDEGYITIPLPYGYNVFFFAGQQLGKIVRGVKSPDEAAGQLLKATVGAFSPIAGESGFEMLAPTVLDFANEFDNNRDWLGRPIRPENPYGDYGPQAYKEFNASAPSRAVARGLNTATGGSPLESGLIDVSPEYIDHFFKFMTGGAGRFAGRMYGLAERAAEGTLDQTSAYEVPLGRVLYTESGEFLNQNRYFEFREAVQEARKQFNLSRETGHPMTEEMKDLNRLWFALKTAESRREKISDRLEAVYSDDTLTGRQREARLKPLKEDQNTIYLEFNAKFIEQMGPQAE